MMFGLPWPLWHVMVTEHVEMIESAGALMVTMFIMLKINTLLSRRCIRPQ